MMRSRVALGSAVYATALGLHRLSSSVALANPYKYLSVLLLAHSPLESGHAGGEFSVSRVSRTSDDRIRSALEVATALESIATEEAKRVTFTNGLYR